MDYQTKLTFGPFELSIVAGEGLYSSPRMFLDDPEFYQSVEVAIFHNGDWASYMALNDRGVFGVIGDGEYSYAPKTYDSHCAVFGYVDVELLPALCECFIGDVLCLEEGKL
jgi:hypothetical protein